MPPRPDEDLRSFATNSKLTKKIKYTNPLIFEFNTPYSKMATDSF